MDSKFRGNLNSMEGRKANDETLSLLSDRNLVNGSKLENTFYNQDYIDNPPLRPDPSHSHLALSSCVSVEGGDSHEDCDFSDVVLKYINRMLMEEDMDEKTCMFQESLALQAAEKSLYEVIGEKYPPSPDHEPPDFVDQFLDYPDDIYAENCSKSDNCSCSTSDNIAAYGSNCELDDFKHPHLAYQITSKTNSQSSFSSSSSIGDGFVDSPVSTLRVPDILCDAGSASTAVQFRKGLEEATKFLPEENAAFFDLKNDGSFLKERKGEVNDVVVKVEEKHGGEYFSDGSRGKKNRHAEDVYIGEERSGKQLAVYTEKTVRSEMFDFVLLCSGGKNESALREALHNKAKKHLEQNGLSNGSNSGKVRGKKRGDKRDLVDLRTLLTLCAQAVAAYDQKTANELLKQIRQHSSPTGDGMQRMAHYFANGIEARLAGSVTETYKWFLWKGTSAADILQAYHLFLAVCPFKKVSNFFSNKTIMHVAEKATKLHIVDYGILYGFQWPSLMQRLSSRPEGPPKLKITGIDFPQPGFKPTERVEETGCRLANYAETFNIPFEFNAIAKNWDTIQIEELNIKDDEVLVVNCQYRLRNLLDETVVEKSPRNIVLNMIRKMKPNVFIHMIVNGAYSSPFFVTRFREALFHFSSLFDMLEANVPREIPERMLIEKELFGREAMNVIACEGGERLERPETYKQWQVRNLRAGFVQLPLNQEIMSVAQDRVKTWYHKDFSVDQDGQWMLQAWKGRVAYALSTWKPAY